MIADEASSSIAVVSNVNGCFVAPALTVTNGGELVTTVGPELVVRVAPVAVVLLPPPVCVEAAAVPVAVAVNVTVLTPPTTCWKLPQVMRVVLAKCTTKLRLPKKAPMPSSVDAKSSVYSASKGSVVILPCFPDRSPTWHVCGRSWSQAGVSPRMKGSRWPRVSVQLPSSGTALTWIW